MKLKWMLPILLLIIISCKDQSSSEPSNESTLSTQKVLPEDTDTILKNTEDYPVNTTTVTSKITSGQYIKLEKEPATDCSCYCINFEPEASSKMCLLPDKIYVFVRFQKIDDLNYNVYFTEAAETNTGGKDIPWNTFDKTTPIATITSLPNNELEVDWLGFSVNGDLVIDYALYGKKTLEGKYKIQ
ncbi:hypothetical protein L1I30_12145 [Gillisia sp. M10.2A]|uniref:Lipoprotein n=1 Tax=Gillisia lutea TaxID=2909668 RepID=A0ABS9EKU4_9FLAO|nr:hypothetical protein [Gillisia lutea]MCF4102420.1 hypothetical protein [Gillisia lutea]